MNSAAVITYFTSFIDITISHIISLFDLKSTPCIIIVSHKDLPPYTISKEDPLPNDNTYSTEVWLPELLVVSLLILLLKRFICVDLLLSQQIRQKQELTVGEKLG